MVLPFLIERRLYIPDFLFIVIINIELFYTQIKLATNLQQDKNL